MSAEKLFNDAVLSPLGSWVIVASAVIILVYIALGWAAGVWKDRQAAVTISMLSSLRFAPVGLFVIATVLKNQSAYLAPALIFCLLDTFIPFGASAERDRYFTRAVKRQPHAAVTTCTAAAPVATAGRGTVA